MPEKVSPEIAKARMEELDRITTESAIAYRNALVGRKERVLFEREGESEGEVRGRLDRFMEILVKADSGVIGKIKTVLIESAGEWFLSGKIVD